MRAVREWTWDEERCEDMQCYDVRLKEAVISRDLVAAVVAVVAFSPFFLPFVVQFCSMRKNRKKSRGAVVGAGASLLLFLLFKNGHGLLVVLDGRQRVLYVHAFGVVRDQRVIHHADDVVRGDHFVVLWRRVGRWMAARRGGRAGA